MRSSECVRFDDFNKAHASISCQKSERVSSYQHHYTNSVVGLDGICSVIAFWFIHHDPHQPAPASGVHPSSSHIQRIMALTLTRSAVALTFHGSASDSRWSADNTAITFAACKVRENIHIWLRSHTAPCKCGLSRVFSSHHHHLDRGRDVDRY